MFTTVINAMTERFLVKTGDRWGTCHDWEVRAAALGNWK